MKRDVTLGLGKDRMRQMMQMAKALTDDGGPERRAAKAAGPCSLYVMATAPIGGTTFVKIGMAACAMTRLAEVQVGCPIPIQFVLHTAMPSRGVAGKAEARLHSLLADFRSSGEWFCFDTSDGVEKMALKEACDATLREYLGDGWRWTVVELGGLAKKLHR